MVVDDVESQLWESIDLRMEDAMVGFSLYMAVSASSSTLAI